MSPKSALLLLVMLRNELVEEPDAERGGALWHCCGILGRPCHPGNIEVRPPDIVNKALDKLSAENAPGGTTTAYIFYIGRVAVDLAIVTLVERQPPDFFIDSFTCFDQLIGEFVIVREQAGIVVAQGDNNCASQSRQIDHQPGLVTILAIPQCIRQHEPAFGVGIQDLDCLARHRGDNVAWPLRRAGRHIFDEANDSYRIDFGFAGREQAHQADDHRGTRHVPFHVAHPRGGFDRNATGVESDPLADKREGWTGVITVGGWAAVPFHCYEARRPYAPLRRPQQGVHAELAHLVLVEYLDGYSAIGERPGLRRERLRVDHIGRLRDQIASEENGARCLVERFISALRDTGGGGPNGQAIERGFLLGLLFSLVLVEPVSTEPGPKGELGCGLALADRGILVDIDCNGSLPFPGAIQVGNKVAAEMLE